MSNCNERAIDIGFCGRFLGCRQSRVFSGYCTHIVDTDLHKALRL